MIHKRIGPKIRRYNETDSSSFVLLGSKIKKLRATEKLIRQIFYSTKRKRVLKSCYELTAFGTLIINPNNYKRE